MFETSKFLFMLLYTLFRSDSMCVNVLSVYKIRMNNTSQYFPTRKFNRKSSDAKRNVCWELGKKVRQRELLWSRVLTFQTPLPLSKSARARERKKTSKTAKWMKPLRLFPFSKSLISSSFNKSGRTCKHNTDILPGYTFSMASAQ